MLSTYLIPTSLLILLLTNLWFLFGRDSEESVDLDHLRVQSAAEVMEQHIAPYQAVFGKWNTDPPHGSPAKGPISSRFGMRIHPRYKIWKMHKGVDIAVAVGTPVMVTADGWVSRIATDPDGWGLFMDVIHPASGYLTRYAHLSRTQVREGQPVRRGHVIALSGVSGNSVGAHLHYEIRNLNGQAVDPLAMRSP